MIFYLNSPQQIDLLDILNDLIAILVDPNAGQGSNYIFIYIFWSGKHILIWVQTINFSLEDISDILRDFIAILVDPNAWSKIKP